MKNMGKIVLASAVMLSMGQAFARDIFNPDEHEDIKGAGFRAFNDVGMSSDLESRVSELEMRLLNADLGVAASSGIDRPTFSSDREKIITGLSTSDLVGKINGNHFAIKNGESISLSAEEYNAIKEKTLIESMETSLLDEFPSPGEHIEKRTGK